MSGQIETGDAERFETYLSEMQEQPDMVALLSPGGHVSEALLIGAQIRETGLSSAVQPGAVCTSACPYVLADGVARIVSLQGIVGLHQHY